MSHAVQRRRPVACDACHEHVPDNAVPWDVEASGAAWRFCSVECMAEWACEQLAHQTEISDEEAACRV